MKDYGSTSKIVFYDSLLTAVVLMSTTLSTTLSLAFGVSSNANAYVLMLICVILILKSLQTREHRTIYRVHPISILLICMILILYFLSKSANGTDCNYTFIQLLFYAIIPILCINTHFDTELVCRYSMYLSLLTVFGGNGWFELQYEFMHQANMGYIYPIVTMLVFAIFHYRYYRSNSSTFIKICYIYNLYMLIRVVMVSNRGALLTILVCAIVCQLYRFNDNEIKRIETKPLFIMLLVGIIVWIIANNLPDVLNWIADMCNKIFKFVPSTIIKMQRYVEVDDIANGRSEINEILYEAIAEKPIYGHGLRTFASYTNNKHPFPHNFILQYLFEGGILFALLPIYLSLRPVFLVILGRIKEKSSYIIMSVLVCQCFPKLLLSSDAWQGTAIWMLIALSAIQLTDSLSKQG